MGEEFSPDDDRHRQDAEDLVMRALESLCDSRDAASARPVLANEDVSATTPASAPDAAPAN